MFNKYAALVRRLADEDSDEIISNSSTDHAAVLIGEMFRRGQGEACLFTGSLNPALYSRDEIIDAVGTFVSEEGNFLRILIQDELDESVFSRKADGAFAQRIEMKFGPQASERLEMQIAGSTARTVQYHFACVGEKAFRFEQDKSKHEAFASFNRPELVGRLKTIFNALWNTEGRRIQ
jgi:hypothetical protein